MNNLLRHLRIADLELFVTAAQFKNLSKAAIVHHLSQSSASAAIQRVEAAFAQALCHHEKKQFRLTPDGMVLLPRIELWLKQFQQQIAANIDRPIRLITTNAIARVILPAVLDVETVDLQLTRPDNAYAAILKAESDLAIVPDNSPWNDVIATEVGFGAFGLYSANAKAALGPILLPENQIEVLTFIQRWQEMHTIALPIKARIPSWSLIADLCAGSNEIGFLPDFLARKLNLHPVAWQPAVSRFRMLALYRSADERFDARIQKMIQLCHNIFAQE